jgi:hypothetical protein
MGSRQQALMVNAAGVLHNFLRVHAGINDLEGDKEYNVEGLPFFVKMDAIHKVPPAPALSNAERTRVDAR